MAHKAALWFLMVVLATVPALLHGVTLNDIRRLSAENRVSCLLVFGDSSVDPGNNNHLNTPTKGNFPPYGMDFINGSSTGRFSNGKLTTDFIGEAMRNKNGLPAFLDPTLTNADLLNGVSFASAGSGYDDLTANLSEVLSFSRQLVYFEHYKIHLRQSVGRSKAEELVRKAVFVMSLGSNDFLQNYFLEPIRPKQFTLKKYQSFLIALMRQNIQELHKLGARRLIIVGLPPLGCMPIVRALTGNRSGCVENINKVAVSFNSMIKRELKLIVKSLHIKAIYGDIYTPIQRAVDNPKIYGFEETSIGCCGTGTYEYGDTCKGESTCKDRHKYIFWDAIHPTEHMYNIICDTIVEACSYDFFL